MFRKLKENFIELALVIGLMGWGATKLATADAEAAFARAPEVTVADLREHMGSGQPVRLRARAVALPPVEAPNGKALAFESLVITHEETRGTGADQTRSVETDYDRLQPAELWLSEGEEAVRLDVAGLDLRFVPELAAGKTSARGALPAEAAAWLAAGFTELPDRTGLDYSLRGIEDGAEVTVYGTVEAVDGLPVLRSPGAGELFVLSSLPATELARAVQSSSGSNALFGYILLLGTPAVAVLAVIWRRRDAAKRTAAAGVQ